MWWGDREESAAHGACGLVAAHQPAEHQGGGSEGGEAAGGDEVAARMEIRRKRVAGGLGPGCRGMSRAGGVRRRTVR